MCRLDLRGTGSSGGIATDEYPDVERADLRAVIEWLAAQPWSSGRVGMFGTSYSGFNSLHMAAEGVPELGAVVATYATDDRYTDDVHYCGGVLRAIDLDRLRALHGGDERPAAGAGAVGRRVARTSGAGASTRHRRGCSTGCASRSTAPTWRRGSIRLGPGGAGYERITCPTMLVAGWADGYRNNTFRTIERLRGAVAAARRPVEPPRPGPGPARPEHRRRPPRSSPSSTSTSATGRRRSDAPAQVFVRRPTRPEPDLALHDGVWRDLSGLAAARSALAWSSHRSTRPTASTDDSTVRRRRRRGGVDLLRRRRCRGASRSTSASTTPGR